MFRSFLLAIIDSSFPNHARHSSQVSYATILTCHSSQLCNNSDLKIDLIVAVKETGSSSDRNSGDRRMYLWLIFKIVQEIKNTLSGFFYLT